MIIMDTHIWIRWSCNDLPGSITNRIERASSVGVSAISCWEVAYLAKRGRLDLGLPLKEWLDASLEQSGIMQLPLDGDIARIAAELPDHHRDPSDRFIIATAINYNAKIISFDSQFPRYQELKNKLICK
ncbi:MAG: type II toxin-antitoxin system VapC family toxin [Desulfuromonadales bacterium]